MAARVATGTSPAGPCSGRASSSPGASPGTRRRPRRRRRRSVRGDLPRQPGGQRQHLAGRADGPDQAAGQRFRRAEHPSHPVPVPVRLRIGAGRAVVERPGCPRSGPPRTERPGRPGHDHRPDAVVTIGLVQRRQDPRVHLAIERVQLVRRFSVIVATPSLTEHSTPRSRALLHQDRPDFAKTGRDAASQYRGAPARQARAPGSGRTRAPSGTCGVRRPGTYRRRLGRASPLPRPR
jgi:hypothetical protein